MEPMTSSRRYLLASRHCGSKSLHLEHLSFRFYTPLEIVHCFKFNAKKKKIEELLNGVSEVKCPINTISSCWFEVKEHVHPRSLFQYSNSAK